MNDLNNLIEIDENGYYHGLNVEGTFRLESDLSLSQLQDTLNGMENALFECSAILKGFKATREFTFTNHPRIFIRCNKFYDSWINKYEAEKPLLEKEIERLEILVSQEKDKNQTKLDL